MQKARRGELWVIDLGMVQKSRPCLIPATAGHAAGRENILQLKPSFRRPSFPVRASTKSLF